MSTKSSNYLFLILTVINFVSILTIYYLYQTKVVLTENASSQKSKHSSSKQSLVIVDTKYGQVGGLKKTFQGVNVVAYLGVPYAAPPLGSLRFRAPQQPTSWAQTSNGTTTSTVFEATNWPPPCLQPDNKLRLHNYDFSADCLYLNIWSPMEALPKKSSISGFQEEKKKKKPVIVLIHTGAFIFGSASEATYDGLALAAMGDLLVVTFNYRLNFYGFAYSTTSDLISKFTVVLFNLSTLNILTSFSTVQHLTSEC